LSDLSGDALNRAQIGTPPRSSWRTHGHDHDISVGQHLLRVCRSSETLLSNALSQELFQPRLDKARFSELHQLDLGWVQVNADDMVPARR